MSKDNKPKGNSTQGYFTKIIKSSEFMVFYLLLLLVINGIVASTTKGWTWVVMAIIALVILMLLMWLLSFLMRKEREDILHSIIQKNGLLDGYLQTKIDSFNCHENCLVSIQKECQKKLEQNFLKQEYEKIEFFNFNEILDLEKSVKTGDIWIITDNILTDEANDDVYDTVGSNINNGTVYTYFYNEQAGAEDAKEVIKKDLKERFKIDDINNKINFIQIPSDYNALLTIAKDIIILHPNNRQQRQAFLCIFASENFEIAFYRKLDATETNKLCDIIRKR